MRTSPSSSSTKSTSTGLRSSRLAIGPLVVGDSGIEPDPATEVVDDLAAHGQADAGTRICGPLVQPLEDEENAISVLRLDADSVIRDREHPERAVAVGRDDDARRLLALELQRVAEQVLEHQG